MLKLSQLNTFWRKITLIEETTPNQDIEIPLHLAFKRLPQDELSRRTSPDSQETVKDFLADVIVDWRDVGDEEGNALPFTPTNVANMLNVSGLSNLLFGRYMVEMATLREKN